MLNSVEKIGLAEGHRKQCRHYINIIFLITCDLLQKEYYVICFSALSSAGLCLWNKGTLNNPAKLILSFSFNALDFFFIWNVWPIHGQGAAQHQLSERPFHSDLYDYYISSSLK